MRRVSYGALIGVVVLLAGMYGARAASRALSVALRANNAPVGDAFKLYGVSHVLVIGNDAYTGSWPRLSNTVKGARLVAEAKRAEEDRTAAPTPAAIPKCPSYYLGTFRGFAWTGGCEGDTAVGKGIQTFGSGNTFEGTLVNGNQNGHGVYVWKISGNRYEGEFIDGKQTGHGVFVWKKSGNRYEGEFRDGKMHGRGVKLWGPGSKWAGDRYEGDYKDGKKHGRGVYVWKKSGNRYEGEFRDGKMRGRGVKLWANGNRYEGDFRNGKPNGTGILETEFGEFWKGDWTDGCFEDDGRRAWANTTKEKCGFD